MNYDVFFCDSMMWITWEKNLQHQPNQFNPNQQQPETFTADSTN